MLFNFISKLQARIADRHAETAHLFNHNNPFDCKCESCEQARFMRLGGIHAASMRPIPVTMPLNQSPAAVSYWQWATTR